MAIIKHLRFVAAGSLGAAVIAMALAPLNMGGCGGVNVGGIDIGKAVSGVQQFGKGLFEGPEIEPALGQAVAVQATHRTPLYRDEKLTRYVTLVGRTVAASSKEPGYKYYFGILDTDAVNAASGPHGYILITRGALARMHDESELAGVLGHEIGHVSLHHGLTVVKNNDMASGAFKVGAGVNQHVAEFGNASDALGNAVLNVGFSEPQEMDADAEGVRYIIASGYNPDGYLHFLNRLLAEQGAGGKPFGTHPGLGDRVKKVSDQIARAGAFGQGQTLADRFAGNVTLK